MGIIIALILMMRCYIYNENTPSSDDFDEKENIDG